MLFLTLSWSKKGGIIDHMFYRNKIEYLNKWWHRKDRTPLIIRGARQVGKSTLVKIFSQNNNIDLVEINLEQIKLKSTQQEEIKIDEILLEIEVVKQIKINKDTLLFFDEIQESPALLKSLRYFYEERPELSVIAAGSLLEFLLNDNEYSFPVGRVDFLNLYPMTFSEFLLALNERSLAEAIINGIYKDFLHDRILHFYNVYNWLGGMPQAIKTYHETKSPVEVEGVLARILTSFKLDFSKYRKRFNTERAGRIFDSLPLVLGKKIIYQQLDRESKTRDIKDAVELMIQARIIIPCYHSNASGIPVSASRDISVFKLYFLDIGLYHHSLGLSYKHFMQDKNYHLITKGFSAEQFIAQHLVDQGYFNKDHYLLYWLRDKKIQNAEIDFLIQVEDQIVPIEVKSGESRQLKSLEVFYKEKTNTTGIKYSMNKASVEEFCHKKLVNLPLYMVESTRKLLESLS